MPLAQRFVGPGGNDSNNGTTYALRKLTLAGAEALALLPGWDVIVAPGVYRETLTPAKAGGSAYSTGTVSVTNGSKTVMGSGTTFTGNAFVDGVFQITQLAHGTDGVSAVTATFTSAAGNFQASMVGLTIRINTKGAYIISAVASATSITLANPDGTAPSPGVAVALTYDVGPESPYDIASVDSNTQLTLADAWSGPTLTAVAYSTWRPIRYIADVTGALTDGVGGVVRITGSNDDKALTRASCLALAAFNYRTFRGFTFDLATSFLIGGTAIISNWIVEDFVLGPMNLTGNNFQVALGNTTLTQLTFRRFLAFPNRLGVIAFQNGSLQDNSANIVESGVCLGQGQVIATVRIGGILVRNCHVLGGNPGVGTAAIALTVGQAVTVNNCVLGFGTLGVKGTVASEIIEDYNSFFGNGTDRTNTTVGQHSNTNPPIWQPLPLLNNGRVEPWLPFSLMAASGQDDLTGLFPPARDLYGTLWPQKTKGSWGAVQSLPLPTMNLNSATWEAVITGRGYLDRQMPVKNNVAVVFSVSVRWDSNATIGTKPSLELLADYGVVRQEVFATGTGGSETITLATVTPVVPTVSGNQPNGRMILRVHSNSTDTTARAVYITALVGV